MIDLIAMQENPERFQQDICLATGSGPRRFGDVMADFQRERFAAVNPSLLAVARHEAPPIPRFWDERTKGASQGHRLDGEPLVVACLLTSHAPDASGG